ncbi:hypothetical protein DI495_06995, partial [Streptococcus dysgalactiae subsp. equisimilis]
DVRAQKDEEKVFMRTACFNHSTDLTFSHQHGTIRVRSKLCVLIVSFLVVRRTFLLSLQWTDDS